VLSYIRGEHLDDLGMVSLRIPRDPLESVDPAEAHIELVAADLVDRSGEALGDLASLVEGVGFQFDPMPMVSSLSVERVSLAIEFVSSICGVSVLAEAPGGVDGAEHAEGKSDNGQDGRRHSPAVVYLGLGGIQAVPLSGRIARSARGLGREPVGPQLDRQVADEADEDQPRQTP
jgi:hypothetical protein